MGKSEWMAFCRAVDDHQNTLGGRALGPGRDWVCLHDALQAGDLVLADGRLSCGLMWLLNVGLTLHTCTVSEHGAPTIAGFPLDVEAFHGLVQ